MVLQFPNNVAGGQELITLPFTAKYRADIPLFGTGKNIVGYAIIPAASNKMSSNTAITSGMCFAKSYVLMQ